jgi:hypothetical protein
LKGQVVHSSFNTIEELNPSVLSLSYLSKLLLIVFMGQC